MSKVPVIIALDPGYGNTKVVIDGKAICVQSAVSKANQIGNAAIGMRTKKSYDVVIMSSGEYAVGTGSWLVGQPIASMDFSALVSEAKRAIFYSAVGQILSPGEYEAELTIGLPVPLLQNSKESATVLANLKDGYKCIHTWQSEKGMYALNVNKLSVFAQPVGAYADWLIDSNLRLRKGAKHVEVAIVDLGMNTLDLFVLRDGLVSERYIGGEKVGVRRLLTVLNGHGQDIEELDYSLRNGTLKPNRDQLVSWSAEVMSAIEKRMDKLERFGVVIPCGGGAMVLGELLTQSLTDRNATVFTPSDLVCSNASGLYKWSAYNNRNRK